MYEAQILLIILVLKFSQIIDSITINDFNVEIITQDQSYDPLVGSNSTLATYQNPFGFSLQVVQSAVDMIIALPDNGTQIASVSHSNFWLGLEISDVTIVDDPNF